MKRLITILLLLTGLYSSAQQEPMFTHYSFNTLSVNPAYAGSRNVLSVTALHRSQWVNFSGAPITQTINIHSPLKQDKIGLGLSFMNDKIGPTNTTGVFGDFAFKIKFSPKGKLAFGIKAGLKIRSNNLSALTTDQPNDPKFQNNAKNEVLPNIGFGVYYSNPRMYLGFGIPYLLRSNFESNLSGTDNAAYTAKHLFFIGGAVFDLSKNGIIKLRPTTFLKLAEGAKPQLDLTALFYFNDKAWLGPMFRTADAVGLLAGANITDQFSFGYSFDWSFGINTGRYNSGGHEIMLRYDFVFKEKGKIESPRYF